MKMTVSEYYHSIRTKNIIHAFMGQDYGYDESGNKYNMPIIKISIIENDKFLYKRDVYFSDFAECQKIITKEAKELNVDLSYIILDKNRDDDMLYIKNLVYER